TILLQAWHAGVLRPGNARTCPVGVLLRDRLGEDINWFLPFYKWRHQIELTKEDEEMIQLVCDTLELNREDVIKLDDAFEGKVLEGIRRLSQLKKESLETRMM